MARVWTLLCKGWDEALARVAPMSRRSRIFQWMVLTVGLVWLAVQSYTDSGSGNPTYVLYLALTALTSLLHLGLPTVAGTISISYVFVLAGLMQLPLTETLAIGITGTIIHAVREQTDRFDWVSVAFQTSVTVLGIEAANVAFRSVMRAAPGVGAAAALPLASIVLFIVTAFPLAAAAALNERELLRRIWKNRYLWSLPYYMAGAALSGLLTVLPKISWLYSAIIILPVLLLVYYAYRLQLESLGRERQHAEELASLQLSMVEALALAVESKDISPVSDLHRMAVFAAGLGQELGLNDEQIKALRVAAVLHDIGQVAVPDHIIMKPGRLTPEEYERLKVHPDVGAEIIERAGFPRLVASIVRAHHERWDGTGYPTGLRGTNIPIEARVLAAVDMLLALSTDRHYRRALSLDQAFQRVKREAGYGLDPEVVEALDRVYLILDRQVRGLDPSFATHPQPAGALDLGDKVEAVPSFLTSIAEARREEQLVLEFTQILGSSLYLQETLTALSRRFHQHIPYETMVLFLRQGDELEAAFIEGEHYALFYGLSLKMREGITGKVAAEGRPAVDALPSADPLTQRNPVAAGRLKSMLSVPLDGPNGVVGTLNFYSERRHAFNGFHLSLLLAISSKLAITVENSARFRQAEARASVDFLTGLPNAGSLFLHLQNELARCARTGVPLGLLVCDLDGFKGVNDRFGHLTGNRLLQLIAEGLKENCREYDFVARMGGDEFVMVMPGATSDAMHGRLLRLREFVEKCGVELCGERVVSLSGGASFYPADGCTAEELLAKADEHMYGEKKERKAASRDLPPSAQRATA